MEYLSFRASLDESLSVEQLQREAVNQGLYHYLGGKYALALSSSIALAEGAILYGLIDSANELASFFQSTAVSLERFRCEEKALWELRIDARQNGLYNLLERRRPHESNTDSEERSHHAGVA